MKKIVVLFVFLSIILVGCGENKQIIDQNETTIEIKEGILNDDKDVHITDSGVAISDALIEGDLYIDKSVGEGEFFLEDVKVMGTIYINGGGPNSGYLINVIGQELIIESETNPNLVLSMNTQIEGVQIACDCRLETTSENVQKVVVNNSKTNQAIDVIMKGDYPEVSLESTANVMIDGTVSLMSILKNAKMTSIEMVDDSTMYYYSCYGKSVHVSGGTIIEAWINAEYCSLPTNTDTIHSEIGVAEVIVGSATIDVPMYTEQKNSSDDSEAGEAGEQGEAGEPEKSEESEEPGEPEKSEEPEEPGEPGEPGESGEPEKSKDVSLIVENGYPTVSFNGQGITISIQVNEPCTVYALVEADFVFSKGTTPENVRDGVSAGAGIIMEDGMQYTIIHKIFNVNNVNSLQSITINMSDYMSGGEDDNPEEGNPDDEGGGIGVFLVVENQEGQLSSLYKFQ